MAGSPFYITIPNLLALQERFIAFPSNYATILEKTLTKAAIQTQSILMSQVPVKTGRLRQSIGYIVKGSQAVVSVDPALKYAAMVEGGTGMFGTHASPIEAKSGSVMATKINPGWGSANAQGYFVIGAYQKGQEANPFMVRTKAMAFPIILATFAEAGQLFTGSLADQWYTKSMKKLDMPQHFSVSASPENMQKVMDSIVKDYGHPELVGAPWTSFTGEELLAMLLKCYICKDYCTKDWGFEIIRDFDRKEKKVAMHDDCYVTMINDDVVTYPERR